MGKTRTRSVVASCSLLLLLLQGGGGNISSFLVGGKDSVGMGVAGGSFIICYKGILSLIKWMKYKRSEKNAGTTRKISVSKGRRRLHAYDEYMNTITEK